MGKIAQKTFTAGEFLISDTMLSQGYPTFNFGLSTYNYIRGWASTSNNINAIYKIKIPEIITTSTGTVENPILRNLYFSALHYNGGASTNSDTFTLAELTSNFIEGSGTESTPTTDGASWFTSDGTTSWSTGGGDIVGYINKINFIPSDYPKWRTWEFQTYIKNKEPKFGDYIKFGIRNSTADASNSMVYLWSKETTNVGNVPTLTVEYEDPSPTKIIDLKIIPNPDNHTQPKLTWSRNEDKDFVQYKIYGAFSPPTSNTADCIATITDQATESYIHTISPGDLSNIRVYYGIVCEDANNKYVSNTDSTGTMSNIASFIKPNLTITGIPNKDVWSTVNATYSGDGGDITFITALGTSDITKIYFEWGDGGTAESSLTSRSHIYTKTGSPSFKMWVENTTGFRSSTSAGNTVTVAGIVPIGVIKVSPILAEPCQSVFVNGSESFACASNLSLTGYSFTVGGITTNTGIVPIKEYKFSDTVGTTKTIYLQVSDSSGSFSTPVSYTVTVAPPNVYCLNLSNPVETVGRDKSRIYSIISKLGAEGQDIVGTGSSNEILRLKGIIHSDKNTDEWDTLWGLSRGNYLVDYRQPAYTDYNEVLRGYLTNFSDERTGGITGVKAFWNADFIVKKRFVETTLTGCVFTANANGSYYDIPAANYPVADSNSDGVVNANLSCGTYDAIITNKTLKSIVVDANYEYRRVIITYTSATTEDITYFYESV